MDNTLFAMWTMLGGVWLVCLIQQFWLMSITRRLNIHSRNIFLVDEDSEGRGRE